MEMPIEAAFSPTPTHQPANDNLHSILRYYCDSAPDFVAKLERLRARSRERALQAQVRCLSNTARVLGFAEFAAFANGLDDRLMAEDDARKEEQIALAMEALRCAAQTLRPEHSLCWKAEAGAPQAEYQGEERRRAHGVRRLIADANVLVIDEDPLIRQIVQTSLIEAGVKHVATAKNFEEAIHRLSEQAPTLVIADWRSEIAYGCDIGRLIRGSRSSIPADTPFIALARQGVSGGFRDAIRTGVDYFLLKPFTRQALLNAVRLAMNKHAPVENAA